MFDPDSFPYTESTGTLDVNQAYSIASDSFPTNPNIFVPQITIAVPEPDQLTLLVSGLLGLLALSRVRRR